MDLKKSVRTLCCVSYLVLCVSLYAGEEPSPTAHESAKRGRDQEDETVATVRARLKQRTETIIKLNEEKLALQRKNWALRSALVEYDVWLKAACQKLDPKDPVAQQAQQLITDHKPLLDPKNL